MRKLLAGLALMFAPAAWAQLAWNSQVYKDANCPPTGSSCTIGPSVICLPSGAMRLCADVNGDGTADTWVGDLDGQGTVGSADWNVDGTVEESGTKFAGAIVAQRFIAERAAGAYDSDGTGSTVSSWTPTSTRVSNIAQSYAHAAMWGDPASYLAPAVFDQYLDVFLGHNIGTLARNESTSNTISQCWNGSCSSTYGIICVTDPASGTGADPDNDGTNEFAVNDVIVLGSQQKLRSHIITAINNGTGSGCPSGTANQWSVIPDVYSDEGHAAGVGVYNVWLNASHTTGEGGKFLGYRLGVAPRLRDGLQGPNLLRNGSADHDSTVENWTVSAGSIAGNGFVSTPGTSQWICWEGSSSACFYNLSGGSGATMDSSDWISVTPGERYVLSGVLTPATSDVVALLTDTNNDGTVEESSTVTISSLNVVLDFKWPRWFWTTFTIPEGAHRVRIRFKKGGANSEPQIDGFSFRKVTTWETDDYTAKKVYLINDPGLRTIVYTGDSWAAPAAYGADIRTGLLAAFTDRFGRDLSSQVKATGVGGYYCKDVLNYWYDLVEKYEPLYLIVSCGVNDVDGGSTTEANFIRYQREIAHRARMIGAIPIFLSVPPFGDTVGASSKYEKAHTFRDAQRRAFLNGQPQTPGGLISSEVAAAAKSLSGDDGVDLKPDQDADGTGSIDVYGPFTNKATASTAIEFDANGDGIWDVDLSDDGTNSGLILRNGLPFIQFGVGAKLKVKLCGGSADAGFFYDENNDGSYDASDDFCWGLGGYDYDCDCNVDQFGDMEKATYDADADSTVDVADALGADPSDCASGAYATAIAADGDLTCTTPTQTLTFTGATAVCNADPALFKAPAAMTITKIHCAVWAATSIPLSVEECDGNIGSCAGVDGATTITCDTDGATDDGSLSNPSIDSGDWIKLNFGSATGTITGATVTIYYTSP